MTFCLCMSAWKSLIFVIYVQNINNIGYLVLFKVKVFVLG